MPEPQPFVCYSKWCRVRTSRTTNSQKIATLTSLQTSRLKGAATMKAMLVSTSS